MDKFFYILSLILLPSCAQNAKDASNFDILFHKNLDRGYCSEAQKYIPLEKDKTAYLRYTKSTVGYVASVSILATTFALDLILLGRCRYGGCHGSFLDEFFLFSKPVYEETKSMRCPDNSYYVRKLLQIAKCYKEKGDYASISEAKDLTNFLYENAQSTPTCISNKDRALISDFKSTLKFNPDKP